MTPPLDPRPAVSDAAAPEIYPPRRFSAYGDRYSIPDEILVRLGKRLYDRMEQLDPSDREVPWETLSDIQREFYVLSVDWILDDLANDHMIIRRSEISEQTNNDN